MHEALSLHFILCFDGAPGSGIRGHPETFPRKPKAFDQNKGMISASGMKLAVECCNLAV
jgi:hypothetical protein